MKAPFAYYGGKSGLAPTIAAMLPPHRVYIEPFFGSGAVLFAKEPAIHEIVNDLDGAVVAFFRCLRDRRDELTEACALTPYARDEFAAAVLDAPVLDELELARRFWARVNMSFAKSSGTRTGFSVTSARNQSAPASVAGRLARFASCAERLMDVTIENCDAAELVNRMAGTPGSVVYADPPYVASTRKTGGICSDYRSDMGDEASHRVLASALHATPATVFLSGYHSPLYDDLYDGWDYIEWHTHAHGSNALATNRGARTEVLWSNRPIATRDEQAELFDTEGVSL